MNSPGPPRTNPYPATTITLIDDDDDKKKPLFLPHEIGHSSDQEDMALSDGEEPPTHFQDDAMLTDSASENDIKSDSDDEIIFVSSRTVDLTVSPTAGEGVTRVVDDAVPSRSPPPYTSIAEAGEVSLDNLLGALEEHVLSVPQNIGASAGVLGKRDRSRELGGDDDGEVFMPDALADEVMLVNTLFENLCLEFEAPPAKFRLSVAGDRRFQVLLCFYSGYPLELPKAVPIVDQGSQLAEIINVALSSFDDGKPCLERLLRKLAEVLKDHIGTIRWKFRQGDVRLAHDGLPSLPEFEMQMESIRAQRLDYPPKLPEFERKDGWKTAFYMQTFALDLFNKGIELEGNERLEFLGDSIVHAMISISMMKKYQLNEGGMTNLHQVLGCNKLFSVFSRAYGFPDKVENIQADYGVRAKLNDFKRQADVFEAAIGGLYEDGGEEPGGWVALQSWFDALIEPWIDWLMTNMHPEKKSQFTTFNRIRLDTQSRTPESWARHRAPNAPQRRVPSQPQRKIAPLPQRKIAPPPQKIAPLPQRKIAPPPQKKIAPLPQKKTRSRLNPQLGEQLENYHNRPRSTNSPPIISHRRMRSGVPSTTIRAAKAVHSPPNARHPAYIPPTAHRTTDRLTNRPSPNQPQNLRPINSPSENSTR